MAMDRERRQPAAASPRADSGALDLLSTPMPRRRMLLLLGAGVVATGGGLGMLLEACSPPTPVAVTLAVDPASLPVGQPVEVPFTMTNSSGATESSAVWMLKAADGSLTAYDPRCTHALCRYRWVAAASHFECTCHAGVFALDGSVISGPPPRPLNKFPLTQSGGTITVDVPGNFTTPRESLGS